MSDITDADVKIAMEHVITTSNEIRIALEWCEPAGEAVGHSPAKTLADVAVLLDQRISQKPAMVVGSDLRRAYQSDPDEPSMVAGRARKVLSERADVQREIHDAIENGEVGVP